MTGKQNQPKNKTRRRYLYSSYLWISAFIGFLTVMCVASIINTTVIHRSEWVAKGDSTMLGDKPIFPIRGDILAADGSILATNLTYYDIRIDFRSERLNETKYLAQVRELADSMGAYYHQRTADQWYDYLMKPMSIPKSKRSTCYPLLRNCTLGDVERVRYFPYFRNDSVTPVPRNCPRTGFTTQSRLRRVYPYGDMARLSIGRVGETADDPRVIGRSGLERTLDTLLYGVDGISRKVMFTRGVSQWPVKPAVNGATITTTIDVTMQDLLENELGEMLLLSGAEWGSAMIMEVATGEIKAISNLDRDSIRGTYIESKDRIVQRIEPGSVIKVVSMLGALEAGFVDLNRVYSIGRSYSFAGSTISDTHSPGALPVSRFVEYSSNIGMTKLITPHYDKNLNGWRDQLRTLGFFDRLNSGMANEVPPLYPTLDPKSGGLVSLSRMTFGYNISVPPLYICAVYNAIANDGRFVRPHLMKKIHFANGRDSVIPVTYVRDRICSSKNAAILREMMHSVVWGEGGTAKGLRNKDVEIAGKTGTAQIYEEKRGYRPKGQNNVTFCGFFPYDKPKYTGIVVVSNPKYPRGAASTGGTVLRNVAIKLFSRGMLDNVSDYLANPVTGTSPTFYGSYRSGRTSALHGFLDFSHMRVLRTAKRHSGRITTVPDVTGLGIREALVELESAGLLVNFSGTGYVTSIQPPPGTLIAPGMRVNVALSQN